MQHPLLLTLEYPPQHGGVARYPEGEGKNFYRGQDTAASVYGEPFRFYLQAGTAVETC